MFSNSAIHGAPIALNMFMNAYIKYATNGENSITAMNSPLKGFVQLSTVQSQSAVQNGIAWLFMFPLGEALC